MRRNNLTRTDHGSKFRGVTITPEELTKAREAAGLTRTQLAVRCGVSERSVYRWESGERRITAMADIAIRQALNLKSQGQDETKTSRSRRPVAARNSNSRK